MIRVWDGEEESGTIQFVEGNLVISASTEQKADSLKRFVEQIQKRKRWSNEDVMEYLPQYLTGYTNAQTVDE